MLAWARARANVQRWASEAAHHGTFTAPCTPEVASAQPGGLPVPYLIVANKTDLLQGMLLIAALSPVSTYAKFQQAQSCVHRP